MAVAQRYQNESPGLGERFLSEALDAFSLIERHPRRSPRVRLRTSREIRRRLLDHFPYAVVYEVRSEECVVVAIAHAARKPGYWRGRLD
jgi:plasmid stabilization system protein ParE